MIDILFIVLMFLLLTTTFREFTFFRVTLPDSASGQRDVRDMARGITLEVEENGTVYLAEQPVSLEQLGRALAAIPDKDNAEVMLAADERLDHGRVVEVMDVVRKAGIFRLSIETITGSAPGGG